MDENDVVSFARKYRPSTFEDYIGNQKVKETLFNTLANADEKGIPYPNRIMLNGFTGCGKTTLARIIIREYLCENRSSMYGACGECSSCIECNYYISTGDAGNLADIEEIDITTRNGKADIEEILEGMQILPMGPWRVVMFDEMHMATEAAQNAMLKVFEEPPPQVLIIVATTNPEKLLPTLVNRFNLRLNIERPTVKELVAHLKTICAYEGVPEDNEGLRVVASSSGRVIREALNRLERVVNSRKAATIDAVVEEFDEIADSELMEFLKALQNGNAVKFSTSLYRISLARDLLTFHKTLCQYVTRGIYIANGTNVDGLTTSEIKSYKSLFDNFTPGDLAVILSELRRIPQGDPELNFYDFFYKYTVRSAGVPNNQTGTAPTVSSKELAGESKERTESQSLLESASRSTSESILDSATRSLPKDSILQALGARKVRQIPHEGSTSP